MIQDLDVVKTTLRLAGKKCPFANLSLSQSFNQHHHFRITVNYEALGSQWMSDPKSFLSLIGEDVVIEMKHTGKGVINLFEGIITNVTAIGRNGSNNNILITGKSTTVRLDGKAGMDSFADQTLTNIIKLSVDKAGNGATVIAEPVHNEIIDYICRYNETCFEFFNRLSWIYGEWFYYDGTHIRFGKEKGNMDDEVEMVYDVNMNNFALSANLVPARFNRYNYLVHDDMEIDVDAPDDVPGLRGFLRTTLERSDSVYTSDNHLPSDAPVKSRSELLNIVKTERSRAISRMLTVQGTSHTCEVKLGCTVKIKMPPNTPVKLIDSFLVTEIEHHVDELDHYSNSFTGIISDMDAIPMAPVETPTANPQQATVYDNEDSKGRVKVQFQWQKSVNKFTNWIRVQTPDAGHSGKVSSNRGYVCIPEIGDHVMVGFEYGDPNRPYVMGSVFPESKSAGGGKGNKEKSITTRSGSALKLDDDSGKVYLADPGKSSLTMDGSGTVTLESSDKIYIKCGESSIELLKDGKITLKGKEIKIEGADKIEETTKEHKITGSDAVKLESNSLIEEKALKITLDAGAQVEIKAKATADIQSLITNIKGTTSVNLN